MDSCEAWSRVHAPARSEPAHFLEEMRAPLRAVAVAAEGISFGAGDAESWCAAWTAHRVEVPQGDCGFSGVLATRNALYRSHSWDFGDYNFTDGRHERVQGASAVPFLHLGPH